MKRQYVTSLLIAAGGAVLLGAGVISLPTQPGIAQEVPMRILTVTGRGSEAVTTTQTVVNLGIEVQGDTAESVQQTVAQRTAAVVEVLQANNVEKLETTGVRLNPQYRYDDGQPQQMGYMGSNTVRFRIPTDAAGDIIDQAVNAGANQIQSIEFVAEDAVLTSARETALAEATRDAQQQANAVLSTLNLGPEEIVGIQIDGAAPPMPVPLPRRAALESAQADVSTPVIGGEQTVEAAVTLEIRY